MAVSSGVLVLVAGLAVGLAVVGAALALLGARTLHSLRRYAAALPEFVERTREPRARRAVAAIRQRQADFDATLWIAHWAPEDAVARLQQLWLVFVALVAGMAVLAHLVVPTLSPILLALVAGLGVGLAGWLARVVLVWQVRTEARIARQRIDNSLANLALLVRVYVQGGASATEALVAISELRDVMREAGARDVDA